MIKLHNGFEWDQFYNPNFNWESYSFYKNYPMTVEFLEKFQNNINWVKFSVHQKLNRDILRKFKHKLDWTSVSFNYEFNEEELEEFFNYINWHCIIAKHNVHLTEEFFLKHKNVFKEYSKSILYEFPNFSDEFKQKFL